MTPEGRAEMIEELSKDADTFEQLHKDILEAPSPFERSLGFLRCGVEEVLLPRCATVLPPS
jgi:hypothetical protein